MTTTHLTHETPRKSMNAGNGVSHLHRLLVGTTKIHCKSPNQPLRKLVLLSLSGNNQSWPNTES